MANENNNAQQRENYFQVNIKRYGENFIHTKSPKNLQFDAKKRLFKEMVYGNINYDEFGKYYTDPQFLDNLIAIATALFNEHVVIATALGEFAVNHGNNPVAAQLQMIHSDTASVFEILISQFNAVKMTGYNIQYLMNIVTLCMQYRQNFSELY